jgi:hypothetical protein
MVTHPSRYSLILLALTLFGSAHGSPLFESDEILEITLSGPLSKTIRSKKERDEYPFVLTVDGANIDVMVRVRGNSRVRLCRLPPLRLNFAKRAGQGTVFHGLDKVKLVTPCDLGRSRAEDNVLNEYGVYRLFNLVSDASYRVRLLRVTYVDTDGKLKALDRPYHSYLIEPQESLARRLQGEVVEVEGLPFSRLDSRQTALMSVFQYAIGNSDWSFVTAKEEAVCCHNIDLIDVGGQWLTIPYDFDLAGFVNAVYSGSFNINQTARRKYGGYCRSSIESIADALREIKALEEAVFALIAGVPALGETAIKQRISYLSEFFDAGKDEEKLLHRFDRKCLGSR